MFLSIFKEGLDSQSELKIVEPTISLVLFSKSVQIINYQKYLIFIQLELFTDLFIQDKIFHTFTENNLIKK